MELDRKESNGRGFSFKKGAWSNTDEGRGVTKVQEGKYNTWHYPKVIGGRDIIHFLEYFSVKLTRVNFVIVVSGEQ